MARMDSVDFRCVTAEVTRGGYEGMGARRKWDFGKAGVRILSILSILSNVLLPWFSFRSTVSGTYRAEKLICKL